MCFVFILFVPLRSSGKMCPWLQAWPSCPNETPTRRRQTLSCIPLCLEDKTPLLPSGGASRTTQGCAWNDVFLFHFSSSLFSLTGSKVSSCIITDIYHVTKRRMLVHLLISHQRHDFWKCWRNCRIHHLVDSWVNSRSKQSYIPAFMLLKEVPDPDLWKNHPALSCNSVFLEKHWSANWIETQMDKMCRFQKCVFALRKSRWCCGLKRVTASVSVPVSLLLTRCRPTTLPPKHRASGKCTSLSPRCLVVVMQRRSAGLPWNKLRICCFDYCLVLDCGDNTQTDVLRINMNSDEWQITPESRFPFSSARWQPSSMGAAAFPLLWLCQTVVLSLTHTQLCCQHRWTCLWKRRSFQTPLHSR